MLKKIINLLDREEINLASQYSQLRKPFMKKCTQCPNAVSEYGDPFSESLLLLKKPIIEKALGADHRGYEELLPTYSFSRWYFNKGELPLHNDRPSCEISVTINICADKEWKIWMKRKETKAKARALSILPGEGILYQGMKYDHWRKPYKGKECMQIFLHYVSANGPFKSHFRDKRQSFGSPHGK